MNAVVPGRISPWRLLAVAGIATLVGLGAVAVLVVAGASGPRANRRVQCRSNLQIIGGILTERELSRRSRPFPGDDRILDLYTAGLIRRGDERAFTCPSDREGLERLAASPDSLVVSYLHRDLERYPIAKIRREKSALVVCLHHPAGVQVLYDDSSVGFFEREELGLASDDPIETGPDAKSEMLRLFPARPAR